MILRGSLRSHLRMRVPAGISLHAALPPPARSLYPSRHERAPPPSLDLDGYTALPPGKVAAVVTMLEMTAPPAPLSERGDAGLVLEHVAAPDIGWYRALFRRIGEEWLWFSRLRLPDEELAALLADPDVSVHVLKKDGVEAGFIELDFRVPEEVELAFVGVAPELVGSGAGRFMMNRALALAWRARRSACTSTPARMTCRARSAST